MHITDAEKQRWEVPYNLLPREQAPSLKHTIGRSRKSPITVSEYSGAELIFSYTADPFGFAVKRKSDKQVLFNSSSDSSDPYGELVFKDQYLEISTKLPKDASLYGLGENSQPHGIKLYPNDPYTLYTTDVSAINLNTDLYGSHPVYMDLRNVGGEAYAHAVLLLNSNGMDVFYRGNSLTYKVIGGVFDFYFFAGSTPLAVVDQYTSFIGRPAPMPYWSLGTCSILILTHYVVPGFTSFLFLLDSIRIWNLGLYMPNRNRSLQNRDTCFGIIICTLLCYLSGPNLQIFSPCLCSINLIFFFSINLIQVDDFIEIFLVCVTMILYTNNIRISNE